MISAPFVINMFWTKYMLMDNHLKRDDPSNELLKLVECSGLVFLYICFSLLFIAISKFTYIQSHINNTTENCEEQSLSNSQRNYGSISTLDNSNVDKIKTISSPYLNFIQTPEYHNQKLLSFICVQIVLLLIKIIADLFYDNSNLTGPGSSKELFSIVYWLYGYLICIKNQDFKLLYHLRGFYFITLICDFYNLRNMIFESTKYLSSSFMTWLQAGLCLNEIILLTYSLILSKRLKDLNCKASKTKTFPSPEPYESILSLAIFSWMTPLLGHGYRNYLEVSDIWDLKDEEKSKYLEGSFNKLPEFWSLPYKILIYFRKKFILQLIISIIGLVVGILTPILLNMFIDLIANKGNKLYFGFEYKEFGMYLVICIFVFEVMHSICRSQQLFFGRRIGISIKSLVTSEIYAKILRKKIGVTTDDPEKSSSGKVANLISVDALEIGEFCSYLYLTYILPLEILVYSGYLCKVLGWPALVGLSLTFLFVPLNYKVSIMWEEVQETLKESRDGRLSVMNEILHGIRIIKFFAWEKQFQDRVNKARNKELKSLSHYMYIMTFIIFFWYFFPILVTLATFFAYTKLAGNQLTSAVAFTSLLVFKYLRDPLDELPHFINRLLQTKLAFERISDFLNEDETSKSQVNTSCKSQDDPIIGFKDATIRWDGGEGSSHFTLSDLNLSFPPNELSLIIGPTGCGKSSLISGLLGEMTVVKGSIFLPSKIKDSKSLLKGDFSPNGGVAYVVQSPWLQQDTIRNNILFGEEYDETRYQEVIKCCALIPDFKSLEDGDLTEVGEKGITLSGGQKQRVSLARAVYSRASHIILDDCLSALDAHTAKYVFHNCLLGDLMKNRTRILVTHNISLTFYHAEYVVVLDAQGKIIASGSGQEVELLPSIKEELAMFGSQLNSSETSSTNQEIQEQAQAEFYQLPDAITKKTKKLVLDEEKATGSVKLSVYSTYLKATGGWIYWIGFGIVFITHQIFPVVLDWWIKNWADAGDKLSELNSFTANKSFDTSNILNLQVVNNYLIKGANILRFNILGDNVDTSSDYYLTVYGLLSLASAIIAVLHGAYMFWGSFKASKLLHEMLLKNILKAPIRFFDTTPVGRLANRFAKDIECLDMELMEFFGALVNELLASSFILLLIAFILPQFILAAIFISTIFYYTVCFYLQGSREIKRYESNSRSPIFSQCDETIQGVVTIRAYEDSTRFIEQIYNKIDENSKQTFYLWASNRWLSINCDLIGGLIIVATGSLLLIFNDNLSAALVGLTFTYALNFSSHILWIARFSASLEMNMNSVERIQEYLDTPSEPPAIIDSNRPPSNWPSTGKIQINDLVMRYAPDRDPVIKGISLDIKGGEKVGIVGRTGAGKSTLALGFFRFMDAEKGNIVIDDIDIYTIGVYDLRSNLTIIPQDATLFSGTIRSNLDPFDQYDDQQLWNALRRVHIIDDNTANDSNLEDSKDDSNVAIKSLDQVVAENGQNFSQGQRQLLSLARALLKQSKVIIMDEATASVDYTTNAKIQTTINEEFSKSTVLCIAHRLRSVIEYDKIVVMDNGLIKEFDTPANLLNKPDSQFRAMCLESGDMEFLEQSIQTIGH